MVTYFNRKDLVSFGSYLLSERRKVRFEETFNRETAAGNNPLPVAEALSLVHHPDVENWIDEQKYTVKD